MSERNWPIPKFQYGDKVKLIPVEYIIARVIDIHILGAIGAVEYDVRYFDGGKENRVRVFEDELEKL